MATSSSQPTFQSIWLPLLPVGVAMAFLVSKAKWFWQNNPELEFGWVVLMLCGYLTFEAWEKRPGTVMKWRWNNITIAVFGCVVLFLTQVYQAAYGLTPASMSGLGIGALSIVMATIHFVFGWVGVRHFAFGFLFILLALPIPSFIYSPIVLGLQTKVANVNVEVLNLFGIPARRMGSLIHLPTGTVGVDEACSGIRSLQSTLMATLFIGYLTLTKLSLRVVLVFIGLGMAIFGNLVRSLFLSFMANRDGLEAIDRFHDTAGWSILAFTVVGVGIAAFFMGKLEKLALAQTGGGPSTNSATAAVATPST